MAQVPNFTMELFRVLEFTDDIGLNEYPIFDEAYRQSLNKKITEHYWMREIGQETLDIFRFSMRRRMNEIMPVYNKLYESDRLIFDPLKSMSIKTVTEGLSNVNSEGKTESETESESASSSRAVESRTPQMMLSGSGDYATGAADTNSDGTSKGTGAENSESATTENTSGESEVSGYQGSPASLLMEYRRSLMNIDMLVIDELSDLFMGVWDNGDNHMPYPFSPLHL